MQRRKTDGYKENILVISENTNDYELIVDEIGNLNVNFVINYEEALSKCREKCYDVIIFSMRISHSGNIQFINNIQKILPHVTIIASVYSSMILEEEIQLRRLGVDDIFEKCRGFSLLKVMIERVLLRRHLSYYDDMTNTLAKMLFKSAVISELKKVRESDDYEVSVVNLDYNKFKEINDSKGHDIGDKLLVQATNIIKKQLRCTDSIFRVGGDEFTILMPNTNTKEAKKVMERICKKVKNNKRLKNLTERETTISVGIARATKEDTEDSVIIKSDMAMYSAKEEEKDIVIINE